MTARGIGRNKRSGPEKRGGRREVSRAALAARPRSSHVGRGRYASGKSEAPAAKKDREPDPEPREPTPEMLELMRDWPQEWRDAAQKVVDFFETKLRLVKGRAAGKPYLLPQWFEALLRRTFGPLDESGKRIARTLYLEVARKNSKSTGTGGIAAYLLTEDEEPGAEVYCAAKDRKQAKIVFNSARAMIRNSPYLMGKVNALTHVIERQGDELSKLEAISSDSGSQQGLDPHGIIIDEIHVFTDRDLVDVLESASGSREQPLEVIITTAGEWNPESIAWEKHEYARGVIDGTSPDPTWVAAIYAAPKDADWKDEKVWALANPNLGVSVHLDYLRREFKKAQKSPGAEASFRRYHLNQWVQSATAWMRMEAWDACAQPFDPAQIAGMPCCSGLDLGSSRDLSAHVLVFAGADGVFYLVPRLFMPADLLQEHIETDKVPYDIWVKKGLITLTPGNVIDYLTIRSSIELDFKQYRIKDLSYDRAMAGNLCQQLNLSIGEESPLSVDERLNLFPFPQNFLTFNEPTNLLMDLVVSGKLRHGGNPVLRWMVSNCAELRDNHGNVKLVKPDKRKNGKRIDGIIAAIMGLSRAKFQKTSVDFRQGQSFYETNELFVI